MYTHCSSASLNLWQQQQQQHFPSENLWQAVPLLLILSLRLRMYHFCKLTLNLIYLQLPTPAGTRRCRSLSHTAHLDIEMWHWDGCVTTRLSFLSEGQPEGQPEAGGAFHPIQGATEPARLPLIAETLTHRQTQHGSLCLLTIGVCLGPGQARDEALHSLLWGGCGRETEVAADVKWFTCVSKLVLLRLLKDKLHLYSSFILMKGDLSFFFVKQSHFSTEFVKADKWWLK